MRAFAGHYGAAIPLMQASRQPVDRDLAGWNPYVEATVAFLRHDRSALAAAKKKLDALPPAPELPPIKNGYIEMAAQDGQTMRMRWPPNADVVDGLMHCIDRSYVEAYGPSCRAISAGH